MQVRQWAAPLLSALLLLAVVITVHNDVKYRTLHPDAATAELLSAPATGMVKTAAMASSAKHAQVRLKCSTPVATIWRCVRCRFFHGSSVALLLSHIRGQKLLDVGQQLMTRVSVIRRN